MAVARRNAATSTGHSNSISTQGRLFPVQAMTRRRTTVARGSPAVDPEALVDVLLRFSTLADDFADLTEAVDVNPLVATPDGLVAVDAPVVPLPHHDAPRRRC